MFIHPPASAWAVLLLALTASAGEADSLHREHRYPDPNALLINDISAIVQIHESSAQALQLDISGPHRQVEGLSLEWSSGRLAVSGSTAGGQSVLHEGVTVIARDGGKANVVIGGPLAIKNEPPLELRFRIPPGLPVQVRGLVGELRAQNSLSAPDVSLLSGSIQVAATEGGRFIVEGSGDIHIGRATGTLEIRVIGSGSVRVADAGLDGLKVYLEGAGEVTVSGVAREAWLRLDGVGDIRVDEVTARPTVELQGVGGIRVGNW